MMANDIINSTRVARVRELKAELAATKTRLVQAEAERDSLIAHLHMAMMALHDFELLPQGVVFRIVDGWNAILRGRNVSKLAAEDVSRLKSEYLSSLGISPPSADGEAQTVKPEKQVAVWLVFDGPEENSYRSGHYRVTYTGGTGPHRADRLILDYVRLVKLLGLSASRIVVETADKSLAKKLSECGAAVSIPDCRAKIFPAKQGAPQHDIRETLENKG